MSPSNVFSDIPNIYGKTFVIDVDGTLCSNTNGSYEAALPFEDAIESVKLIFENGGRVILFTARGSTTGIDWRGLTESQMKKWGVPFHELILGKPFGDYYIDDKALHADVLRK